MEIEDIIKKIGEEKNRAKTEVADTDGLLRLQEVEAAQYDGEYKLIWSEEIVERLKENPPVAGHKTGIVELDDLTGGFREQQLITMFAHTKHGKTEVSMWMTGLFPELAPVVIPLEQNAEEIISQRLEREYEVPRFLSPLSQDTFVSTDWIEQRVIEGIAKHNTKMLVIDHLGYIDNNGENGKYKKENLAYRIGMVMKELKGIAKRWNVIIILLVHVSEGDEGKPPQLTDIGNSSDIKKESDTVIGIWRKNGRHNKVRIYENKTMLSVLANRRFGSNGNIGLEFDTKTGIYLSDNDWVKDMEDIAKVEVKKNFKHGIDITDKNRKTKELADWAEIIEATYRYYKEKPSDEAREYLDGFLKTYGDLKQRIESHDYTQEDAIYWQLEAYMKGNPVVPSS